MEETFDLAFGRNPHEEIVGKDYVNYIWQLMYGIHEDVRGHFQTTSDGMEQYFAIWAQGEEYIENALVWLHNSQRNERFSFKLQHSWDEPYRVMKRIKDVVYRIYKEPSRESGVVHFIRRQQRRRCSGSRLSLWPPTPAASKLALEGIAPIAIVIYTTAEEFDVIKGLASVSQQRLGVLDEVCARKPRIGREEEKPLLFRMITKLRASKKHVVLPKEAERFAD